MMLLALGLVALQTITYTNAAEELTLVHRYRLETRIEGETFTQRRRLVETVIDGNVVPAQDRTPPAVWSAPASAEGKWRWPLELPEGEDFVVLATVYGLTRADLKSPSEVTVRQRDVTIKVATRPSGERLTFTYRGGGVEGKGWAKVRAEGRFVEQIDATYTGLRLPGGELPVTMRLQQRPEK
jgi:hypothetical protein